MLSDSKKTSVFITLTIAFLFYSFYLYADLPVKNPGVAAETAAGKSLWQKHNCNACHQLYGLGGYLGPDLTNVYSKKGPGYIKAFLKNGTDVMPDFHLTAAEMNALTAYLHNIDSSGKADPKTYTIQSNGSITQQQH